MSGSVTAADVAVGRKISSGAVGDREDDSITVIVEKVAGPIVQATDSITKIVSVTNVRNWLIII